MAILPWGHSRNQTNSSTEKLKSHTLDWFSRTTAEPSRQAIHQLMKQHSRAVSGGSVNLRLPSRAGTPSSQKSHHRTAVSVDSRTVSTKKSSLERSAASQSRPDTPTRSNTSNLERSDSGSKSLFQKGGLLRRKRSKTNMNLNTSSTGGVVSSHRPASSRAGSRSKDLTTSPIRDDPRPSISKPFDFTHIMHGDLSSFTGLGRIDEGELACQFDAIQARYRTTTELGEQPLSTPQTVTPIQTLALIEEDTALPQISTVATPATPPPAPPPKNSPLTTFVPTTPNDVRTSRSTENFSRPNPRSPTTPTPMSSTRPSSCLIQHVTPSPSVNDLSELGLVKPLPQLPTVVHAVSTEDDTARLLISAPLPSPPTNTQKGAPRHHRQSSSRSSLRHMSSFPSSRHPQISAPTQEGQLLRITEEEGLTRPHSENDLTQRTNRRDSSNDVASNKQPLEVEDWEVAIDSAWDLEDDMDSAQDEELITRSPSSKSRIRESYLTIEQPTQDDKSLPSTPLMTMAPVKHSRSRASAESRSESPEINHHNKRNSSCLVGLGIEANGNTITSSRVSRPPTLEVITSENGRPNVSPRVARSAYSAISHSSSQESIILSIASSIMSTQRSSISSVCASDYTHAGKPDRASTPSTSPLLNMTVQKAARPESTCLPSALLQQMNQEMQKAARPDSTCLPSVPSSQRNSVVLFQNRPESICLPKDMLAGFPIPETRSCRRPSASTIHSKSDVEGEEDQLSELPKGDPHNRATAGARGTVSHCASSSIGADSVSASRQRSNTQGSRTRPARTSYSLFPTGSVSAPIASGIEVDGVTS